MIKPKVGVVFVVIEREAWKKAEEHLPELLKTLGKRGLEVIYEGKPAFNIEETVMHSKEAAKKGADCICYVVGTWIHPPQIVTAALEVDLPIVLVALKVGGSLVGAACTRGSLDEMAIPHLFVYGKEDDTEMIEKIAKYARAAITVKKFRGKTYGLIGGRSMGMYPAMVDFSQVKKQFGVEVEHIAEYRVIIEAEKIPEERARKVLEEMKVKYAEVSTAEDYMIKSIKLYLALKKIVEKEGLDFIGIKCQPEVISNYSSYCVAVAFMNNEGIVTACECDTNAALTMEILHLLTDQPAFLGDVGSIDEETGILKAQNCGSAATSFAKTPKEVHWLAHPEFMHGGGSPCVQFICKPGKVTCARLSRINQKYHMLIFTGETVERPRERLKQSIWEWPHAFIKMDCSPVELIRQLRSNHIHFVYGNHKQELIHICDMLEITPIVLNNTTQ